MNISLTGILIRKWVLKSSNNYELIVVTKKESMLITQKTEIILGFIKMEI